MRPLISSTPDVDRRVNMMDAPKDCGHRAASQVLVAVSSPEPGHKPPLMISSGLSIGFASDGSRNYCGCHLGAKGSLYGYDCAITARSNLRAINTGHRQASRVEFRRRPC